MDIHIDLITEIDLQAYVDDELPPAHRIAVETYLCCHPAQATRVMADLRTRDELRLALADSACGLRVTTTDAAVRLETGLSRDRTLRRVRWVAVAAILTASGWFAHAEIGPLWVSKVIASALPPTYVDDAIMAHRTTLIRAAMHSQPEVPSYDPAEIRTATAIVMPSLPGGWAVANVQIFPSTFGPSVEIVIRTQALGTASLFAVRPGKTKFTSVTLTHKDDFKAAYWQVGEVAYALVAKAGSRELDKAATRIAKSLL
jgi:anti-sigma factor RsiW